MFPPRKLSVLLLEDEPLLAIEMEDALLATDRVTVTTAHNLDQGLEVAKGQALDFAVLDWNLGRNTDSIPVAEQLASKGVPFAFVTANTATAHEAFPEVPVFSKPFDFGILMELLAPVLGDRRRPIAPVV